MMNQRSFWVKIFEYFKSCLQEGRHLADDNFGNIFLNENICNWWLHDTETLPALLVVYVGKTTGYQWITLTEGQ